MTHFYANESNLLFKGGTSYVNGSLSLTHIIRYQKAKLNL